jgi:hypothetical protein
MSGKDREIGTEKGIETGATETTTAIERGSVLVTEATTGTRDGGSVRLTGMEIRAGIMTAGTGNGPRTGTGTTDHAATMAAAAVVVVVVAGRRLRMAVSRSWRRARSCRLAGTALAPLMMTHALDPTTATTTLPAPALA